MGKFSNNITKVTVICDIGQSNCDGRGIDAELLSPYRTAISGSKIF